MGVGCIIRNPEGGLIQAMSKTIPGCLSPADVEALTLREAVRARSFT